MATAISLLAILTLSVIAVKAGSVALWLTGLPRDAARFQARSAFTTTGFTTPQAALVVNHPERRRVISVLMILGNAGIVVCHSIHYALDEIAKTSEGAPTSRVDGTR